MSRQRTLVFKVNQSCNASAYPDFTWAHLIIIPHLTFLLDVLLRDVLYLSRLLVI